MDSEEYGLTIRIEFDDFITRLDLDEVLESIDRIIEQEIFLYALPKQFPPPAFRRFFPWDEFKRPQFTYLGIRSIERGSLIIAGFIGGAVLTYIGTRFAKGVDESLLADELERSGRLTGDSVGRILNRINNWAERYVSRQRDKGGNITKIAAKKEGSDEDRLPDQQSSPGGGQPSTAI